MTFWTDARQLAKRGLLGGMKRIGIDDSQVRKLIRGGRLTPEQRTVLSLMRSDNANSGSPFEASEFWRNLNVQFDLWLETEGLEDVAAQTINQYFSGPEPSRPLSYASWLLFKNLQARDRFGILGKTSATVNKDSGLGYEFEGCYVSWDLLISIDTIYSIAEVDARILTDSIVVVDLGAGWGRIGHVLKSINPNATYVICDLPEGLLVSSNYLPQQLPGVRAIPYAESRTIQTFSRELLLNNPSIRFCGTQDLARFEPNTIDFFINVASFQEMTQRQVRDYFAVIDRKVNGTLYLQQYWNGLEMGHTQREIAGFEEYPFLDTWKKHYARNVTFSNHYFEAAMAIGNSSE